MWKNSLKNVESDNNKILYETLIGFLQRNGTYFLNNPLTQQILKSQHKYIKKNFMYWKKKIQSDPEVS